MTAPLNAPIPKSRIAEIAWPAIPVPAAVTPLTLLQQLGQSQWWPPEVLRVQQFHQLDRLVAHAQRSVPFYRERLAAMGYAPERRLDEESWARLPILRRREVQEAGESLRSTAIPPAHGKVGMASTSGSTGTPVKLAKTELCALFWGAFTLRENLWHGRDLTQKLAVIRRDKHNKFSKLEGLRLPNWGSPVASVYPTGPLSVLDIMHDPNIQLDWLVNENPTYLLSLASNLQALAELSLARGLRPSRLEQARSLGEVLEPETREAVRRAWGVEIADTYSAEEIGYMALQCPSHGPAQHVQSESVLLEVLDDDDRPVAPGAVGRVVVTPLHNFAMPLIRYEIGDWAETGGACACGRGLPVLTRILGRTRNLVTLPSGARRYASIGGETAAAIPAVVQYQMVQKSLDEIEFRLVARRKLNPSEEERLATIVEARYGHRFRLRFTYVEEIKRAPSGKFEMFISEIAR